MDLNSYQAWTKTTAVYSNPLYPVLGLAEEAGELVGKMAKYVRDGGLFPNLQDNLRKEAGDVLWMLARVLDDAGINFQDCLDLNVEKLSSRKDRGVIKGSGDNR